MRNPRWPPSLSAQTSRPICTMIFSLSSPAAGKLTLCSSEGRARGGAANLPRLVISCGKTRKMIVDYLPFPGTRGRMPGMTHMLRRPEARS